MQGTLSAAGCTTAHSAGLVCAGDAGGHPDARAAIQGRQVHQSGCVWCATVAGNCMDAVGGRGSVCAG